MSSTESVDEAQLQFEGFTLDVQRRALYYGGERVRLTPTPFKTLLYLARNSGVTVSKEQLLDTV